MARLPTLNPDGSSVGNDGDSTVLRAAGTDENPKWRLVAVWSNGGSATLSLNHRGRVTIGRGKGCDILVDDASVSREHAAVSVDDVIEIRDLGSKNGTRVGGRLLAHGERARLEVGIVAEVGEAMLVLHRAVPPEATPSVRESERPPPPVQKGSMAQTNRLIDLVAKSSISVILSGETGVGKEVLAERIHRSSPRTEKPFIGLNCAALPDALLESELFGHERGAFTGAVQAKTGLLEAASGGTVFLDELGELPLTTQAKLLRALENREATRVGGVKPRPFDVRFIAATNRDLEALVKSGSFRADLYFRLNGITIRIPPLRERSSEILPLAQTFLADASKRSNRKVPKLSAAARARLERHAWPGNVRELRNVVDRAIVLCGGDAVEAEHIMIESLSMPAEGRSAEQAQLAGPPTPGTPPSEGNAPASLPQELAAIERQRIVDALERCGGNQKLAAKMLGISRRTLVYRLDTHGIARPRKRD